MSDATGSSDITPAGFPTLTPPTGAVTVYFKLLSTAAVSFQQTPLVNLSAASPASFATNSCYFYGYVSNNGTSSSWTQIVGPNAPSGGTVNFPATTLGGGNTVDFKANQPFYGAIACL